MKKNYQEIASRLVARENCAKSGNEEWYDKHQDVIDKIMAGAPSGSGIDSGTKFNEEKSNENKLVFETAFHHMNDGGMYDGWTEHQIIVTPSLTFGFELKITGKDRNQIKEYLYDVYSQWLNEDVEE